MSAITIYRLKKAFEKEAEGRDALFRSLETQWCGHNWRVWFSTGVDFLSLKRNILTAMQPILPSAAVTAKVIAISAILGGLLGTAIGGSLALESRKRFAHAHKAGDTVGRIAHLLKGISGASYATLSSVLAVNGIFSLHTIAPALFGVALIYSGFSMYGAIFLDATAGLFQTISFDRTLNQALENGGLKSGVECIRDQVSLTAEELKKSPKEQAKLLQKKWNRFERCVGEDCSKYVRENLPDLCDGKPLNEVKAERMVLEVKKGIHRQKILYKLLIIIALVGIASIALGIVFLSGPAAPLVTALAALLWLYADNKGFFESLVLWRTPKSLKEEEVRIAALEAKT